MKWTAMVDAYPPENKWVLVCAVNGNVDMALWLLEDGDRRWFNEVPFPDSRYYRDGTFTHWMPLPELA